MELASAQMACKLRKMKESKKKKLFEKEIKWEKESKENGKEEVVESPYEGINYYSTCKILRSLGREHLDGEMRGINGALPSIYKYLREGEYPIKYIIEAEEIKRLRNA